MLIGQALTQYMQDNRYNISEVSRESGISRETIYQLRRSEGKNLKTLAKVCKAMDLELSELIKLAEDLENGTGLS